jgi:hypothetical protein
MRWLSSTLSMEQAQWAAVKLRKEHVSKEPQHALLQLTVDAHHPLARPIDQIQDVLIESQELAPLICSSLPLSAAGGSWISV